MENESNPKLADFITDVNAVTKYDIPFQTVPENIPFSNTKHVVLSKANDLLANSQFNIKPEVIAIVNEVDDKVDKTSRVINCQDRTVYKLVNVDKHSTDRSLLID